MPLWLQNFLVLTLALACLAWLARGVIKAILGHPSRLAGCGSCGGCGTRKASSAMTPPPGPPAQASHSAPQKLVMVPLDSLVRSSAARTSDRTKV